ncbi:hypothetical protein HPP92_024344 [Vanilla planifolia]|uniref:Uncharacterized protein n=1 Tax=Vanilla planifolia TaxID=51239 RepID=A0A835PRW0_VANPL|nr:hypothetical protein HPP92_024344 [Vanilla planifolia]
MRHLFSTTKSEIFSYARDVPLRPVVVWLWLSANVKSCCRKLVASFMELGVDAEKNWILMFRSWFGHGAKRQSIGGMIEPNVHHVRALALRCCKRSCKASDICSKNSTSHRRIKEGSSAKCISRSLHLQPPQLPNPPGTGKAHNKRSFLLRQQESLIPVDWNNSQASLAE